MVLRCEQGKDGSIAATATVSREHQHRVPPTGINDAYTQRVRGAAACSIDDRLHRGCGQTRTGGWPFASRDSREGGSRRWQVLRIVKAALQRTMPSGRRTRYEHTWSTAILRLFNLTAGCRGANEKALLHTSIPFYAIHLHPGSRAGYYPGAKPIALSSVRARGGPASRRSSHWP